MNLPFAKPSCIEGAGYVPTPWGEVTLESKLSGIISIVQTDHSLI